MEVGGSADLRTGPLTLAQTDCVAESRGRFFDRFATRSCKSGRVSTTGRPKHSRVSAVISLDDVPSCFVMYATVVRLSIKNRIDLFRQCLASLSIVRRTASISSQFIWRFACTSRHLPASVLPSNDAHQPCVDASDVTITSGVGGTNGAPCARWSSCAHYHKSAMALQSSVTHRLFLAFLSARVTSA